MVVGLVRRNGHVGGGVHGGVFHQSFEAVLRIGLVELGEAGEEPVGRWGLGGFVRPGFGLIEEWKWQV